MPSKALIRLHIPARTRRASLRAAVAALAAGLLLLAGATPALAHGRGTDATNFRSHITDEPDLGEVTWRVLGADEFLWVRNASDAELVILGYEGEPYLRIGSDGVWRNRNSEATYLNADRYAQVVLPAGVDPTAPPDWEQLSAEPSWMWHDHRIHWMAPILPPQVEQNGGQLITVLDWEVPFTYEGSDQALAGRLDWVPPPPAWPWLVAGLLLALPALGGLATRPSGGRWTRLARPAAAVLGVASTLNLANLVNDVAAAPLPLGTILIAAVQTMIFVGLGLFGAVRAWRGDYAGFVALGIGCVGIHFGQGILLLGALTNSQLETVFPAALTRAGVAVSLAQLIPLLIVAALGARRLSPTAEPEHAAGGAIA